MALPIPIPHNLTKNERDLSQTLSEICRRAVDGTAVSTTVPVYVSGPGGGLLVPTPNGLHTYLIGVANDGAPTSKVYAGSAGSGFSATSPNGLHTYVIAVANNGAITSTLKTSGASGASGGGFYAETPNGLNLYLIRISNNGAVTSTKTS